MATDPSHKQHRDHAAEPPSAGRTTQESIRQAAHRPVAGPASSDRVAAGGGLEVPAGKPEAADQGQPVHEHGVHESGASGLIPGARELDNLTHREPGALSGQFNGGDLPSHQPDILNEAEKMELYLESGLDRKAAARKARSEDGKH